MAAKGYTFQELTKKFKYGIDETSDATLSQIKVSALLRIAEALEQIATTHCNEINLLKGQITGLKAEITKLKKDEKGPTIKTHV